MRREDSLLWRLAELDIAPADINYVINTHLHFDHAGNNDMLKDSKFFVQREHYEYAKDNPAGFPHQYWNLPGLSYELVDGAATLFPGVEVIPTPGHAPAHQSVLLRLPETGNMLISGTPSTARRTTTTTRGTARRTRPRPGSARWPCGTGPARRTPR